MSGITLQLRRNAAASRPVLILGRSRKHCHLMPRRAIVAPSDRVSAIRPARDVPLSVFVLGIREHRHLMAQHGYLTNIASQYFVISLLSRLGMDVSLTLGNKKQVDIVVTLSEGRFLKIDVKADAGKRDWIPGSSNPQASASHYFVLEGYEGNFNDPLIPPRVWVVPSLELAKHAKVAGNGRTHDVPRKAFLASGREYEPAWELLQ